MKLSSFVSSRLLCSLTLGVAPLLLTQVGCGGVSPNEQVPGETAYLELGALAVDPRTDTIFSLQTFFEPTPTPSVESDPIESPTVEPTIAPEPVLLSRELYAIRPQDGSFQSLGNVFDVENIALLFPKDRLMMVGYLQSQPLLRLYDAQTLSLEEEAFPAVPSWGGVTVAPSGSTFAVQDWSDEGEESKLTLTLGSLETFETHSITLSDSSSRMVWSPTEDRLVLSVYTLNLESQLPNIRVLSWTLDALEENAFALDEEGLWLGASVDIRLEQQLPGKGFYSVPMFSPEGDFLIQPTYHVTESDTDGDGDQDLSIDESMIHLISLPSGQIRTLPGLQGPANFTPDGSTLVANRQAVSTNANGETSSRNMLVMVDVETLAYEETLLSEDGSSDYFVTREGNFVVIDMEPIYTINEETGEQELEDSNLMIFDIDAGVMRTITDSAVELADYVTRPGHGELWSLSGTKLYRIDYVSAEVQNIRTSWESAFIHYLPNMDKLVLMEKAKPVLHLVDPDSLFVEQAISLPTPEVP